MTINIDDPCVGFRDPQVVPRARIDEVLGALDAIRAKEAAVEQAIEQGAKWPAWLDEALEARGVCVVR